MSGNEVRESLPTRGRGLPQVGQFIPQFLAAHCTGVWFRERFGRNSLYLFERASRRFSLWKKIANRFYTVFDLFHDDEYHSLERDLRSRNGPKYRLCLFSATLHPWSMI